MRKCLRKKYVYIDTPLEKIRIEKFWKNRNVNIKNAFEFFIKNTDISIKEIQKKYNVYTTNIYQCLYQLKYLGLITEV